MGATVQYFETLWLVSVKLATVEIVAPKDINGYKWSDF